MNLLRIASLGIFAQAIGLIAFILVSRSDTAGLAKQAVIGVTIVAMLLLLWMGVQHLTFGRRVVLAGLLAIGYIITWEILGITFFPGLLKDFELLSLDNLRASTQVALFVFLLYAIGSVVLSLIKRGRAEK